MRRKNSTDVLEMISRFQETVLKHKPPADQMYQDVRMMKFKVRPLQGDIAMVDLDDKDFIEILWSLGKLDEFYQGNVKKISRSQQDTFFKIVDEMYFRFQEDLNTIDLKREQFSEASSSGFEMEIFKDNIKSFN